MVKYLSWHGQDDNSSNRGLPWLCEAQIFLFEQAFVDNKFVDVNPQTIVPFYPGKARRPQRYPLTEVKSQCLFKGFFEMIDVYSSDKSSLNPQSIKY